MPRAGSSAHPIAVNNPTPAERSKPQGAGDVRARRTGVPAAALTFEAFYFLLGFNVGGNECNCYWIGG